MATQQQLLAQLAELEDRSYNALAQEILDMFGTETFWMRQVSTAKAQELLGLFESNIPEKEVTMRNRLSVRFKQLKGRSFEYGDTVVKFDGVKEAGDRKPTAWRMCLNGQTPDVKAGKKTETTGNGSQGRLAMDQLVMLLDYAFEQNSKLAKSKQQTAQEVWAEVRKALMLQSS